MKDPKNSANMADFSWPTIPSAKYTWNQLAYLPFLGHMLIFPEQYEAYCVRDLKNSPRFKRTHNFLFEAKYPFN